MNLKIRQVRENSFGWLVKMLSQKIDTIMESELRSIGLTRGIFATLMMLSEQEGVNQTELGNAIGIPGYATTPGWLGYSDELLVRLSREAVADGFRQIKYRCGQHAAETVNKVHCH